MMLHLAQPGAKTSAGCRLRRLVISGLIALAFAGGCGQSGAAIGAGLSSGDERVCADAAQNDVARVGQDGPGATNSDIKKQVSLMAQTYSYDVDEQAIQSIVQICKNNGYKVGSGAGSANSQGSGGSNPGGVKVSAEPSGSLYTKPPSHGIVTFDSTAANPDVLAMVDPQTGRVLWQVTPPSTSDWSPIDTSYLVGFHQSPTMPYDLEDYSTDLRRVTAKGPNGEVGWIDMATGIVTDVSQKMPAPSPAFGQSPSIDINPRFSPSDNSFWFERVTSDSGATVLRMPAGNNHAETMGALSSKDDAWEISNRGELVNLHALASGLSSFGTAVVNPSGSIAFACESGEQSCWIQSPLGTPWQPLTVDGPASSDLPADGFTWISDTTLIGAVGSGIDTVTITGSSASVSTLLPSSQAQFSNFVASPDGKAVYFAATTPNTGSTAYFYVISLSAAGNAPNQVGPLAPGLQWFPGNAGYTLALLVWR